MPAERNIDMDHQLDLDLTRVIYQRRRPPR